MVQLVVLLSFLAHSCKQAEQQTKSTRSSGISTNDQSKGTPEALPPPTTEATGDARDPLFSDNLKELALLLEMDRAQLPILRKAFENDPMTLKNILVAVRRLAKSNKDLLVRISKDLVQLADYMLLNKKLQFAVGATDADGKKLVSIGFVGAMNQPITELVIGKDLLTSIRVFASYENSAVSRDVTALTKMTLIGTAVIAGEVTPGLYIGKAVGESATVETSLGIQRAQLVLKVRDASVSFIPMITNELTKEVGVSSLPIGVIGSLHILAELRDFNGTLLSTSDVSESGSYASTEPRIQFLNLWSDFTRKGLFAGESASTADAPLSATITFKGRTETLTTRVKITPAIPLYSYFSGELVNGDDYYYPQQIHCSMYPRFEYSSPRAKVFFLGDEVAPFTFHMFLSDCTLPDKTLDPATQLAPGTAIALRAGKWIAIRENKSAGGAHLDQLISGIHTVPVGGAPVSFPSKNSLLLNIRERIIAINLSNNYTERPRATCPTSSSVPSAPPADLDSIRVFTWLSQGSNNCTVREVTYASASADIVQLQLSVPALSTYTAADVGTLGTGSNANLIALKSPRDAEDRVLIVTATFDLRSRCVDDPVCLSSAQGTVTKQILVPGSNSANQLTTVATE